MPYSKDDPMWHKALKFIPFGIIVGFGLLISGICCLCIQETITTDNKICNGTSRTYDYKFIQSLEYSKNCIKVFDEYCHTEKPNTPCTCTADQVFHVTQLIKGDIIIAYELESDKFFNRNGQDETKIRQSRDDQQLNGNLNMNVSSACGEYSYDGGKPIAPCGALADIMFNDTINTIYSSTGGIIPTMRYNLLHPEQKIGFKNPPSENLAAAFKNFTKPKSWSLNVWELDQERPENNGFENEAFIAWMSPNLNIRPMARLNRSESPYTDGLPPDNYTVSIEYRYPYSLYDGTRKLNLYVEHTTEDPLCNRSVILTQQAVSYDLGVAGVVIGVILLLASLALVLSYKVTVTQREKSNQSVNNFNPRVSTNHPQEDSTDNHGSYSFNHGISEPPSKPNRIVFIDDGDAVEAAPKWKPLTEDEKPKSPKKPPVIAEEAEPELKLLKNGGEKQKSAKKSPSKPPLVVEKAGSELKALQDDDDEEYL